MPILPMTLKWTKLKRISALLLAGLAGMAGCSTGPDYSRPNVISATAPLMWAGPALKEGELLGLAQWWLLFGDASLTQLITAAHANSSTVAEAYARLAQARGLDGTSLAAGQPVLTIQSQPLARQGSNLGVTASRSVGLQASWELDLFGGLQREHEASAARLLSSEFKVRAAHVAIAGDVGSAYFARRGCEAQLRFNAEDLSARKAALKLTRAKLDAGLITKSEVAQAAAALAEAESQQLALKGTCDRTLNQLVALTGMPREEVNQLLGYPQAPKVPKARAIQPPAELLSARADIRSAEALLMAASAGIGVAQADMLPKLTLSGVLTSLTAGPVGGAAVAATTWSFASGLTTPLLDGGRRRANLTVAQAKYEEALASYQGLVRTAVREVEDALSKLATAQAQVQHLEEAQAERRKHFETVWTRHTAGAASRLDAEEARRPYISAQLATSVASTDLLQAHVALYRALGGGWSETCSE